MGERQWQGRGRRVAELGDAVDDAIARKRQPLADRAEDPAVRLVIDEQIDLIERHLGRRRRLLGRLRQPRHRLLERLVPEHLDRRRLARHADRAGTVAVRAEHDRPDPARLAGRDQHDRTGPVGEHRRRPAISGIGDPRHQVRADDHNAAAATRIDQRCAGRERGHEAGAGGADVEPAGARGADHARDQRRRVRQDLVCGRRRDQHDVDLERVDPCAPQRVGGRGRGVLLEALVRRCDAARADPGAALDPVGRQPEAVLDLGRGDDRPGQVHADRSDRGAPESGRRNRSLLGF